MKESDKTSFLLSHIMNDNQEELNDIEYYGKSTTITFTKYPLETNLYRYYIDSEKHFNGVEYSVYYLQWHSIIGSTAYPNEEKCTPIHNVASIEEGIDWCVQHWMENVK